MTTEKVTLTLIQSRTNTDYNFIKNGHPISGYENSTGPPIATVNEVVIDGVNLDVTSFFSGRLCQTEFRLVKDLKALAAIVENLGQGGGGPTKFVAISANDPEADYLEDKLIAGEGISLVASDLDTVGAYEILTANASVKRSVEIDLDQIQLTNDETAPGNSKFFGTDLVGAKGWQDFPVKNSIEEDSNELQLVNDEFAPSARNYYGTNILGTKGWNRNIIDGGKNSIEIDNYYIQLRNDEVSLDPSKYYGSDSGGNRGFHDLPNIEGDMSITEDLDVDSTGDETVSLSLVNDEAVPGVDKFYGTDYNGTKGYQDIPSSRSYFFSSL